MVALDPLLWFFRARARAQWSRSIRCFGFSAPALALALDGRTRSVVLLFPRSMVALDPLL